MEGWQLQVLVLSARKDWEELLRVAAGVWYRTKRSPEMREWLHQDTVLTPRYWTWYHEHRARHEEILNATRQEYERT